MDGLNFIELRQMPWHQDTSGNIIYDNPGFPYLYTISNNIIRQDTSDTTC